MNSTELARRIRLGGDSKFELKRISMTGSRVSPPKANDLAAELVAFANGRGGMLVLGVDKKTREVTGIPHERLDTVLTWVRKICTDSIQPSLNVEFRKFQLRDVSGKLVPIICISVERSLFVHRTAEGCFHRIGDTNLKMSGDAMVRLFQQRTHVWQHIFDESAVPYTSFSNLDHLLTSRFLREDTELNEKNARKLTVAGNIDGKIRLSVAGVLLCTRSPHKWLPQAQIQAVSYTGERCDVNYQSDARVISGPLDSQVKEALHFVNRNMRKESTKTTTRTENKQLSERVVFEALVNAVAHRDYSILDSRIRLHIFRDRIELYVPGNISNKLTVENLHLRQFSRNQLIVSLLARCPAPAGLGRSFLMDQRGDGVPIIREETRKLTGRLPEYSILDESELRLVIPAATISKSSVE